MRAPSPGPVSAPRFIESQRARGGIMRVVR
jgi:hypothetical protein